MIKFAYNVKKDLIPLILETVINCDPTRIVGYVEEGTLNNVDSLKINSLYLVAELNSSKDDDSRDIYKNPLVLVSKTQQRAAELYREITGKVGSIVAEIEHTCDKLKVEPL